MNLLGNLPLKCLDVLLTLEPHEGSLEFLGVNMDVICVLLSFLEKRLHQVGSGSCCVGFLVTLAFPIAAVTAFVPSMLVSGDQLSSVIWVIPPAALWSSQVGSQTPP